VGFGKSVVDRQRMEAKDTGQDWLGGFVRLTNEIDL
jgi:hypothetical protein